MMPYGIEDAGAHQRRGRAMIRYITNANAKPEHQLDRHADHA